MYLLLIWQLQLLFLVGWYFKRRWKCPIFSIMRTHLLAKSLRLCTTFYDYSGLASCTYYKFQIFRNLTLMYEYSQTFWNFIFYFCVFTNLNWKNPQPFFKLRLLWTRQAFIWEVFLSSWWICSQLHTDKVGTL